MNNDIMNNDKNIGLAVDVAIDPVIDLAVIGHTVIDHITFQGHDDILPGGSAPAVALSAADNGTKVGIMTRIGNDFPRPWLELLKKKIDIEGMQIIDGKTTSINIDYASDGNIRGIDISQNVSNKFGDISFPKRYLDVNFVHICPLPINDQLELVEKSSKHSKVSVDFNQVYESEYKKNPNVVNQILGHTDIIFPNEFEARSITGINDIGQCTEILYDRGPSIVVITLGGKGSIVYDGDNLRRYSPNNVTDVIDPTGCGDAFIGGFLSTYIETNDIDKSMNMANIMAAKKIMKKGAWCI